jgi:hypothetical protein
MSLSCNCVGYCQRSLEDRQCPCIRRRVLCTEKCHHDGGCCNKISKLTKTFMKPDELKPTRATSTGADASAVGVGPSELKSDSAQSCCCGCGKVATENKTKKVCVCGARVCSKCETEAESCGSCGGLIVCLESGTKCVGSMFNGDCREWVCNKHLGAWFDNGACTNCFTRVPEASKSDIDKIWYGLQLSDSPRSSDDS